MKKETVITRLTKILYGILFHDLFLSEIVNLIFASGFEEKVFTLLIARLRLLSTRGAAVTQAKEFESIGSGLYSMHLAGKGFNLRILFSFLPNRQPVLLLAFHEREGKKKTDYSTYLDPALSRFDEKKEDYNHGFI
jgi:Uncharacterized protein conserved in bacteria